MNEGAKAGDLRFLSDDDLQRVYQAGLTLLSETGILSESDLILDLFDKAGARVDREKRHIFVSPDMVESALETAPRSFVWHGIDPTTSMHIEPGRVFYGMGGSSEPKFFDYDLGRPRRPTQADMVANTRVGNALPNVDFVMTLCTSGDVPVEQAFFYDLDAILRNTRKPIAFSVLDRRFTVSLLKMLSAVCGGESELRQRPIMLAFVTPVSPMVFPTMVEGVIDCVEAGIPVLYSPGPMMNGTGPATIAGMLAQSAAELLFGLVLIQLVKPGAPLMFKIDSDVMDPSTGQCTYGSPEQVMGRASLAQLCRFLGVPSFTMGGGVEAKLPDSEAAAQATMGMLINGLSGVTASQALGTMGSGLYGSPEQLVICDEIAHMVKHILGGFEVNDDTLALDVIRQVGHGGDYLMHPHTLDHFKQETFFPVLFKRQSIEQWVQRGAKRMDQVARERVLDILAKAGPVPLADGADEALKKALDEALDGTKTK